MIVDLRLVEWFKEFDGKWNAAKSGYYQLNSSTYQSTPQHIIKAIITSTHQNIIGQIKGFGKLLIPGTCRNPCPRLWNSNFIVG